jgi:H+/gluconate symporter-like permease
MLKRWLNFTGEECGTLTVAVVVVCVVVVVVVVSLVVVAVVVVALSNNFMKSLDFPPWPPAVSI